MEFLLQTRYHTAISGLSSIFVAHQKCIDIATLLNSLAAHANFNSSFLPLLLRCLISFLRFLFFCIFISSEPAFV